MTRVYCTNVECLHNDGCMCSLDTISVGDDYGFGCDDYEDYLDKPEYQTEFFIRVKAVDGKEAKAFRCGKKIEYCGYVFYTTDNEKTTDITVTEERTGMGCGYFERLKDPKWFKRFEEACKKISDVEDLPLTEYNSKTRKYEYVNRGNTYVLS